MVDRNLYTGLIRLHLLHHAAEGPVHGSWLSTELGRHGYRISPGTLYPLLHRLADAGLITGNEDVVDGRMIRRYRATRKGERALAALRTVIGELADEVAVPAR